MKHNYLLDLTYLYQELKPCVNFDVTSDEIEFSNSKQRSDHELGGTLNALLRQPLTSENKHQVADNEYKWNNCYKVNFVGFT